jgi:hypothetical protein
MGFFAETKWQNKHEKAYNALLGGRIPDRTLWNLLHGLASLLGRIVGRANSRGNNGNNHYLIYQPHTRDGHFVRGHMTITSTGGTQ